MRVKIPMIKKVYLAICENIKKDSGSINIPNVTLVKRTSYSVRFNYFPDSNGRYYVVHAIVNDLYVNMLTPKENGFGQLIKVTSLKEINELFKILYKHYPV